MRCIQCYRKLLLDEKVQFGRCIPCRRPLDHPIPIREIKTVVDESIEKIIRDHFLKILDKYEYNRSRTSRALGLCVRTTRLWIRKYRKQGFIIKSGPREDF